MPDDRFGTPQAIDSAMVSSPTPEPDSEALPKVRLGYVPLTDSAPIIVAREKGFFRKHGLDVQTSQQPGWATVRDRLVHGEIDAAHCLGPLALAIHFGIGTRACEVSVPLILCANGNGITLSNEIPSEAVANPIAFQTYLEANYSKEKPLTLAAVHPCSSHAHLLRLWLLRLGVSPQNPAINLISLPPGTVLRNLAKGHLDGFCVGEPWNSAALGAGIGWCAATSTDLSNGHPEKVLVTTRNFTSQNPQTVVALTTALLEACLFCQDSANHQEIVTLLSNEPVLCEISEALSCSLAGRLAGRATSPTSQVPNFHIFHSPEVNAPRSETAFWLTDSIRQSGLLATDASISSAEVFRLDLFEKAQAQLS